MRSSLAEMRPTLDELVAHDWQAEFWEASDSLADLLASLVRSKPESIPLDTWGLILALRERVAFAARMAEEQLDRRRRPRRLFFQVVKHRHAAADKGEWRFLVDFCPCLRMWLHDHPVRLGLLESIRAVRSALMTLPWLAPFRASLFLVLSLRLAIEALKAAPSPSAVLDTAPRLLGAMGDPEADVESAGGKCALFVARC